MGNKIKKCWKVFGSPLTFCWNYCWTVFSYGSCYYRYTYESIESKDEGCMLSFLKPFSCIYDKDVIIWTFPLGIPTHNPCHSYKLCKPKYGLFFLVNFEWQKSHHRNLQFFLYRMLCSSFLSYVTALWNARIPKPCVSVPDFGSIHYLIGILGLVNILHAWFLPSMEELFSSAMCPV